MLKIVLLAGLAISGGCGAQISDLEEIADPEVAIVEQGADALDVEQPAFEPDPTSMILPTPKPEPTLAPTPIPTLKPEPTCSDGERLLLDQIPGDAAGQPQFFCSGVWAAATTAISAKDIMIDIARATGTKWELVGSEVQTLVYNFADDPSFAFKQEAHRVRAELLAIGVPSSFVDVLVPDPGPLPAPTPTSIPEPASGDPYIWCVQGVSEGSFLNLRVGPGVNNPIVFEIPDYSCDIRASGSPRSQVVDGDVWIEVRYEDHANIQRGWVSQHFVLRSQLDRCAMGDDNACSL